MNGLLGNYLQGKIRKTSIPVGRVNGVRELYLDDDSDSSEPEEKPQGTDYAKDYIKEEMERYTEQFTKDTLKGGGMTDIDDGLSVMSETDQEEIRKLARCPEIYDNYKFESTFVKKELPIDHFKSKVINMINTNSVVVIQGPTGCGKTTQVPQYILDDCRVNKRYCNIVVTQPRKIATITVCRRVCEERGWTLSTVCGYQVGLEKKLSQDTILSFVTTGVLLQKLITVRNLNLYTHIIIDEVHERNQELDFLLLVIRKFLFTQSSNAKVILMSATIDAEELAYYFRTHSGSKSISAPIIYIDKEGEFVNHIYYADHLNKLQPLPRFDIASPELSPEGYNLLKLLIGAFDNLDAIDPATNQKIIGSVLVFVPGIYEIEEAQKCLSSRVKTGKKIRWHIIPLHSSLPNDEQAKAFYKPKPGERKIILATNIAESSITVPDIFYVIDFCLTKVMVQDPETKFMSLVLEWASHVNCQQRAGRCGRVANGRVYRLVDSDFYHHEMRDRSIPEILRAPLDRVVLQAKLLDFSEPPKAILALALNPPDLSNIESTIWRLKECGGLLPTCKGVKSVGDGDLTFLGKIMANLPVDVRMSKLIVLGHIFNCLKEAIIIAAGCSIQNIFKTPFQRRYEAYRKQLIWADESCSDLIALLTLYNVWQSWRRVNATSNNSERHWCDINYVNLRGLQEWGTLVAELTQRLKVLGIEETAGPQKPLLDIERPIFLKVIMCGAFYPNYFTRSVGHGQIDEREAVRTLSGRDPFRCVYLTGFSSDQPGHLYVKQIKKLIQMGNEVETKVTVSFDGSSKVYIEFPNYKTPESVNIDGQQVITTIPGRIAQPVYEAVRKRQLKMSFDVKILPGNEAWEYSESLKKAQEQKKLTRSISRSISETREGNYEVHDSFSNTVLPSLDTQYISIVICWKIDAGHFWCQNSSDDTNEMLTVIENTINRMRLDPVKNDDEVVVGNMYVARYVNDGKLYRCKVTMIDVKRTIYIVFVDYGNMQTVRREGLFWLPNYPACHVAPIAMECVLAKIKPKVDVGSRIMWGEKANKYFESLAMGYVLYGKVHSVVDDIVHLELYKNCPGSTTNTSVNQLLVDRGFAEWCTESFRSLEDHKRRAEVQSSTTLGMDVVLPNTSYQEEEDDFDLPNVENNKKTKIVRLRGPFSPLEMKVYGIIRSSFNKTCDMEGSSVNTVLLDDDPQNPHTRLLVAAYVGQGMSGNLKLRQTTLMPKITGFPMLVTLMFCPMMEPKLNEDGTRVAAILCGLGTHDSTGKPCYPAHDLMLTLDTELDYEIINQVNKIRFYMNQGIQIMEDNRSASSDAMIMVQQSIKKYLWSALNIKMKSVPPVIVKNVGDWGRQTTSYKTIVLSPLEGTCETDIWPLLKFTKLNTVSNDDLTIKENTEKLSQIAERLIPFELIECKLCNKSLATLSEVRFHLIHSEHKRLEVEFLQKVGSEED